MLRIKDSKLLTPEAPPTLMTKTQYERLWFSLRSMEWSSLALVPTSPGPMAVALAEKLMSIAQSGEDRRVSVVDATGMNEDGINDILEQVAMASATGDRFLVSTDFPPSSATAVRLMNSTSRVLLVISLGTSQLKTVRSVAAMVPTTSLVGSVVVTA